MQHDNEDDIRKLVWSEPRNPEQLIRKDGARLKVGLPSQLIARASWGYWRFGNGENLCLIDFGQTFAHGPRPASMGAVAQPLDMHVPESIFTNTVWTTGALDAW